MNNPELLAIYLRDHHATAGAAIELCRRIAKHNGGNVFGRQAEMLGGALAADRHTLEAIMEAVDVEPSRLKDAGAWLGEKMGRLKLNGRVVSYSPLSRVFELEYLAMATQGRILLAHTLRLARQTDQRLADFDFGRLETRAREHLERIESLHRQAVEATVEAGE